MKRWKVRILVLLLLLGGGAIVNVAVAWGCAQINVHTGEWTSAFDNSADEQQFWRSFTLGGAPQAQIVSVVFEGTFGHSMITAKAQLPSLFVPTSEITKLGGGSSGPPIPEGATSMEVKQEAWVVVREAGWPSRSLRYTQYLGPGISSSRGLLQWSSNARPLPAAPIWPGFAINTVFYAFMVWLLFALGGTPFALRRRRRIKRGLCPKCAYPVGTNEVCTECGAAVVKQKAEIA